MNLKQKSVKHRILNVSEKVVLVAVKFSLEIQKNALIWALTHVAQPGDCVKLLVVISPHSSSYKLWSFTRLRRDCISGHGHGIRGTSLDQKDYITDSCTQMMLELHQHYDPDTIKVKVKVVSGSQHGVVAAEAKRTKTQWVILDKGVEKEAKCCMDQLDCNVVVMKKSRPKVLRLNLIGTPGIGSVALSGRFEAYQMPVKKDSDQWDTIQVPNVTPVSSPEHTSFTGTDIETSSISSLDHKSSLKFISEIDWNLEKDMFCHHKENHDILESDSDADSEKLGSPSTNVSSHQWVMDILSSAHEYSKYLKKEPQGFNKMLNPIFEPLDRKISVPDRQASVGGVPKYSLDVDSSTNLRDIVSLTTKSPSEPPPLCSVCQHKAPVFGKPPRWFTYAELEHATGGFSQANFLAEGGYGSVHRGILPDGQVIAVKQHKAASSQGDREFCSEVEILSCAQHRNVVMLIGFCVEGGRRLLVYECICNGSLNAHLFGRGPIPLDWSARQKIAVGAARGLRYLHEDCRVGCIIHRDLRPNNILLTHDFEPLVGDFGLARWQPDGEMGYDTRVIGTFGYLSPEYVQSGQITEKADVYAFGVVLIELVTGRKAVDINRPKGQQYLTEWARPLLEEYAIEELIDPLLCNCYSEREVKCMMHCASLCIQRDPHSRPRMSQVLRMLEGDSFMS